MKLDSDTITKIVFSFIIANVVLYFIEKATSRFVVFHRVVSIIDTIALFAIASVITFSIQPAFVVVVWIILAFEYPIVWGIRTELTKDEAASLVIIKSAFPISKELDKKIALAFLEIATFPLFYVMKSWSKNTSDECF